MWNLSEKAQWEANQLYSLLRRTTFLRSTRTACSLIERLAWRAEPGAIPAIAGALHVRSLHKTAAVAISQLLSKVPSKELVHLSGILGGSYGWHISEPWGNLRPKDVNSVAGDTQHRTSVLGLLSFHHNGYVRHKAIRLLAQLSDGDELRYLLIRQNDWVDQISRDAQDLVRERLAARYIEHFVREAPLVIHLLNYTRRDLRSVVRPFIELLVHSDQCWLLEEVLDSEDRAARRCIADLALEIVGAHRKLVVRLGIRSTDPVLRLRCSRAVGDMLQKREAAQICSRLLLDTFMPVRREAYLLRIRLFPESAEATWRRCLFDKSRSLRELARYYLRDTETDVPEVYREALCSDSNNLAAVSGIAEMGDASDLSKLQESLASPRASIRAEAIRGIGRVGSEDEVLALARYLTDPSPRAVREASRQLQPHVARLGPEFLMSLRVADTPEYAWRRILRMVFGLGRWQSLPHLIHAAAMENDAIASYAEQLIELWISPQRSRRVFIQPTDHERRQISAAISNSSATMRAEFLPQLTEWLKTHQFVVAD